MRLAAAMYELEKASLDFRDWFERTNFSRPIAGGLLRCASIKSNSLPIS
jgi:hypothetical protein